MNYLNEIIINTEKDLNSSVTATEKFLKWLFEDIIDAEKIITVTEPELQALVMAFANVIGSIEAIMQNLTLVVSSDGINVKADASLISSVEKMVSIWDNNKKIVETNLLLIMNNIGVKKTDPWIKAIENKLKNI